jgi:hypothetical protein
MRLIPPRVYKNNSNAEIKVFDLLKRVDAGDGSRAIHSLNVSEHQYKKWCELDFVIITPQGILVLEIKGGRVSRRDGVWKYTNRFGQTTENDEGPFNQANSGMEALRKFILKDQPVRDPDEIAMGWGAIFPDQQAQQYQGCEIPPEGVLHRQGAAGLTHGDLKDFIIKLSRYWYKKKRRHRTLNPDEISDLAKYLRPNFDMVPALSSRLEQISDRQNLLTRDQCNLLEAVEESPRILCSGGAGTGKTYVAIEAAKRESENGKHCLIVCRNPILAGFIRSNLSNTEVKVYDLETLKTDNGPNDSDPKADCLIVDEAQDVLNLDHIEKVFSFLKGGIESGRWRVFMDQNNQSAIYPDTDPVVLEYLRSFAPTPLKLKKNCRNTTDIVFNTQLFTGADIGEVESDITGPKIQVGYYSDPDGAVTLLANKLNEWLREDVRPEDIAILTPNSPETSVAGRLGTELRNIIRPLTQAAGRRGKICLANIRDFKGLEQEHIALVDFDSFDGSKQSVAELYVGMTRARARLWMSLPEDKRTVFSELHRNHSQALIEAVM